MIGVKCLKNWKKVLRNLLMLQMTFHINDLSNGPKSYNINILSHKTKIRNENLVVERIEVGKMFDF